MKSSKVAIIVGVFGLVGYFILVTEMEARRQEKDTGQPVVNPQVGVIWPQKTNEFGLTSTMQQEVATAPKGSILRMKDGWYLVLVETNNPSIDNFVQIRSGFGGLERCELRWLMKETAYIYKPTDCPAYNGAATRLALQMAELQAPKKK